MRSALLWWLSFAKFQLPRRDATGDGPICDANLILLDHGPFKTEPPFREAHQFSAFQFFASLSRVCAARSKKPLR